MRRIHAAPQVPGGRAQAGSESGLEGPSLSSLFDAGFSMIQGFWPHGLLVVDLQVSEGFGRWGRQSGQGIVRVRRPSRPRRARLMLR